VNAKNKVHANTAYVLLAVGALLLLGGISNSGWRLLALLLGALNLCVGAVLITTVSIIEGVPWLIQRLVSATFFL
jgi:hypothetical protein